MSVVSNISTPGPQRNGTSEPPGRLIEALVARIRRRFGNGRTEPRNEQTPPTALSDLIVATTAGPPNVEDVFGRLRWGGLFLFVSQDQQQVEELAPRFTEAGFLVEEGPRSMHRRVVGVPVPFLSPKTHYFVARKALLLPPGQTTERFTYHVQLLHYPSPSGPLVVLKEVPSLASVIDRLTKKFPEVGADVIRRRARKFTEKIFPTFLTREAAMLRLLDKRLPEPYSRRVPHVIETEKDDHGLVCRLWMNWLPNNSEQMTQMEFARQSADLLRVVHDVGHVIHLDLRLDNFVVTEHGVGFVDFGSAVREDENLEQNPLLGSLFDELMRTSQIQRMLSQMALSGHVTSEIIRRSQQKVDKAIDFFYLAVQFNKPHANPELADLIKYDPEGAEAKAISRLTHEILRPADPEKPMFRSAADILHGVERLAAHFGRTGP
jgi:tRNA A-37 threonylcarbamoyl transferase component Bud32